MKTRDVFIKTPCGADWSSMDPRGSARFCGRCTKLVHDLSALSESEARDLLSQTSESLCVRYLHDASGQIWFRGGQQLVPVPRLTRGRRGLTAVALAAVPVLFQACGGADPYGSDPYDAGADIAVAEDGGQSGEDAGNDGSDGGGEGGAAAQAE